MNYCIRTMLWGSCGLLCLLAGCRPHPVNVAELVTDTPVVMAARLADATELTILLGGDTYFGETYPGAPEVLRAHGYEHMLAGLRPLMDSADWSVLNLETPVTRLAESPLQGRKELLHRGDPVQTPAVLKAHGLRLNCLANNHALDYGVEGLVETMRRFREQGVDSFGAGTNVAAAVRPWLGEFTLGGHRQVIALVGGFDYHRGFDRDTGFYAIGGHGGVANLDGEWLPRLIVELRRRHPGIFIIAFPHWGRNYDWKTARQQATAQRLLSAGADVVLGHGAHHLQEVERIADRWVVYNLGNFLFGSPGRYSELRRPPFSLTAMLTFRVADQKMRASLKLYPILSDNRHTGYQPRLVTDTEFAVVEQCLRERCPNLRLLQTGMDNLGRHLLLELP